MRRCPGDRLEVILDLSRPGADIVTAVAEGAQRRGVHQAIVSSYDAPFRRIDETRILGRRKPPVPSTCAIGPRRRKASVVADAAGDTPRDRPANPSVALRGNHVLRGDSRARRRIEQLLERLRHLDPSQRTVHAAFAQWHPSDGAFASARIAVDDGPPNRLADFDWHADATFDVDGLVHGRNGQHPRRRPIATCVRRVGLEDNQIAPIAGRVGETPCDVPIAARNQPWHARKGDPGEAMRPRVAPHHRGAIPDVRRRQTKVHVVGDDRAAAGREATRHCPIVAAAGVIVGGWREPCQPYGIPVCIGARGWPCRWWHRARIEHARIGYRRDRTHPADERSFPVTRRAGNEVGKRCRKRRVHGGEARFAARFGILQGKKHRCHDQHRVLEDPRPRLRTQEEIFRGFDGECREPGVNALDVGAQHRTLVRRGRVNRAPRACTQSQHACPGVDRYRRRAEQFGQLSRGPSPREVHLEEAILRMQEP